MYYSKYIKYKNKYLNLKYQLGGTLDRELKINKLSNTIIPDVSKTLEPIVQNTYSLQNSLIGLKVLESNSKVLTPLVTYNKKFEKYKIYFYRYTDKSGYYILCSLYSSPIIFKQLQKKNVRIQKISVDEYGNISLSIKNISIPEAVRKLDLKDVKKKLMEDLVGIKVLQTNSSLLIPLITDKEFNEKNKIHYYTYADKDESYILVSLYDYYEFLDILYEHIEIEEVKIDEKGVITLEDLNKIYHIIPKPTSVSDKAISLPIKNDEIVDLKTLVFVLKGNLFIIIKKNGWNSRFLPVICMYNLFIGTIHVFEIVVDDKPTEYFLLSLFTEYELNQKCIYKPPNVELNECRLYKQNDRIESKLYRDMVDMMFKIYIDIRESGYHKFRYYRGNPAIDNKFLDVLDPNLLEKCKECISVKDIAFNTTLWLLPDKIGAKDHPDILDMEKDFLNNKFELINSNEKIQSWRYNYENLIQLWEYSLGDLRKEIEKFKNELLGLEPCYRELLVLKLNDKGYKGDTMEEILKNSALCYLNDKEDKEYKNKRLVYENSEQIDPIDNEFIKNCKFIPEMKKLLNKRNSCEDIEFELHKYRQAVLLLRYNTENEKKYINNQSYFFAESFYIQSDKKFDKAFDSLGWTIKLNKLAFECLIIRHWLIFPIRIINFQYLKSPLSFEFNKDKLNFCGYFYTRFTDNYNGDNNFNIVSRDKFYFIYFDNSTNYKLYKLFYYTGNSIWFEISLLPYYRMSLCEINWIYYTFILKYEKIPHFYKYINDYCEEEIVVSRFSLYEIYRKYEENCYDATELDELEEVFYNHNYYKREKFTQKIFVDKPILKTEVEQKKFIDKVLVKIKL